jgi:hypothetical protein
MISSSIYCFNDVRDVEADRLHPKKCNRPIASGKVSIKGGYVMMILCLVAAFVLLLFTGSVNTPYLYIIIGGYWLMNVAYCIKLKQIAILDVSIIAIGFVIRVLAGGLVVDIWVSHWLVMMTFLVTLFMALSKRNDDYRIYDSTSGEVVTTTIENQEYFSVVPFVWGDDILIDLDHESGFNGIYSVNGNRMITGFTYDEFYKDINYEGYDEMRWIEGQYIIARKDHDFRLIRLRDGQDLIRANKRVFVHGQFLIAYNDNGERRVYDLEGKQLRVAVPKSNIYIQNDLMVYADYTDTLFVDLMNSNGGKG